MKDKLFKECAYIFGYYTKIGLNVEEKVNLRF